MSVEMEVTGSRRISPRRIRASHHVTDMGLDAMPMPIDHEEDDSSLSSSSPEIFDLSLPKDRWPIGQDGKRQRYGSTESAPSTGISSICSSIAAGESATTSTSAFTSPSRKRMADGSLKLFPDTSQTSTDDLIPQQPPPKVLKRRGRPPKPKSTLSEKPLQTPAPLKAPKPQFNIRPRSSIPSRLPTDVFASQCIEAAYASRLDPYALHIGEHELLVNLLMSKEVTVYLNIRNAILRLWRQNPLCSITADEAAGCAKETRFFGIAEVAYKWLVRNGYINFGCVEVLADAPIPPPPPKRTSMNGRQRTVVVVGAGVAGLTAARQLENLFKHDASRWTSSGERPPRVVVLEGRKRIGGRVYSKPLRSQVKDSLPDDLRNTAEMGAMIVTGFEHGNPLDTIIRGQLGLRYHMMKDALTIYDCDGQEINEKRDLLNTELYTDISDRAGAFRATLQKQETLRGDEELINRCRDPAPDGFSAFELGPLPSGHIRSRQPAARRGRRRNAPPGTEKLTGRSQVIEGESATLSASRAAKNMGWQVREGVARNQNVTLNHIAGASRHPTLGSVMDEAIAQYQDMIDLTPQDMRLLNWHHANLEYANAAPVSSLSLSGHDQDTGNEFAGAHSEVIGGYTQVPRGLMNLPTKLDVRFDQVVDSIHYYDGSETDGTLTTKVVCTNGEVIEADEVVVTAPLGVLKANTIDFDPPLPSWKQGAIGRMGFGLLNKVVLLYDTPFWDDQRDMFGLLNEAETQASLDPVAYERRRGRFYLIWNASKISGRPMLIALMAGMAAHEAEYTDTTTLLNEVTDRLRGVYGEQVPAPLEVIVTRWKKDRFTRGTYSYVGPQTRPGDYDIMAKRVGNLHFAGEATCGTHPATVHGAFLSGLRVASDVMESMAGPITLPDPLVGPGVVKLESSLRGNTTAAPGVPKNAARATLNSSNGSARAVQELTPIIKQEPDSGQHIDITIDAPVYLPKLAGPPAKSVCASDASFWISPSTDAAHLNHEAAITAAILSKIGNRPIKPARPGVNPFLLFTKAKWEECKAHCGQELQSSGRDMIRQTLGKWWRAAGKAAKQPYIDQSQAARGSADAARREWEAKLAQWDSDAATIRQEHMRAQLQPSNADG